ncbi:hypothetical protein LCGC14_0632350 [marine sediment metagenome]|uniref:Uncharacterized protein n=1 Tax=marine sediment metagenome TaxID=412755 RepID=A0A0F9RKZ6_9ZZZZ|nr:MAG: hypothetical protein Lokiarch_45950 [Candidatus Lokiarchaeum sp. GC14_75]HEC36978.1 hypothetical protein [bacterium]
MSDNKKNSEEVKGYPKEIVTLEKIIKTSKNFEKVRTIVSNEYEEKAVNAAIAYMDSFNNRDASKCDESLNFPHVRLGLGNQEVRITENPPQNPPKFFEWFVNVYKWNHSCWDYRKVIQSNPNKVHLAIQFSRYRSDGTQIGIFPSFWVMTNQNNHWGIKMRSSFAP